MFRLSAVAFLSFVLLTALRFPPVLSSDTDAPFGPLVVNEIHAAPEESAAEFIEILNRSDRIVSLSGVTYADANEDFDPVVDEPADLRPGQRLVLVRDSAAAATAYPDLFDLSAEDALVRVPPGWEGLNNGGDTVFLRIHDALTDRVDYGGDWAPRGVSMERIDPNGPSQAFNFAPSQRIATPGRRNSRYAPDVDAPFMTFAEEVPTGGAASDGPINAPSIRVVFSEGLDSERLNASAFSLDGRPVHDVTLADDAASAVVELRQNPPRDATPVLRARGLADRTGNVREVDTLSLALQPRAPGLRITELMVDPRADAMDGWPDQTEYVELRNVSPTLITLRGLQLTGATDEHGESDELAVVSRAETLPPGGYAVLYAAGDLAGDTQDDRLASLAAAFPDADTTRGVWIEAGGSSLRLTNSGRRLLLRAASGAILDSLAYTPDWHAPELVRTDGIALERISEGAPSSDAATWTSSAHPDGGTPGRANSVFLPPNTRTGANVSAAPNPFSRSRDSAMRIQYALNRPAASLRIRIYDAHGRLVRTLAEARRTGPSGEILWDGRTEDGRDARMGIYVVLFEAVDMAGGAVETAKVPVVLARP